MSFTPDELENIFRHHPPSGDQEKRYVEVRTAALQMATTLNRYCPESREKTVAIRKIREAMFYGNAAIACNE